MERLSKYLSTAAFAGLFGLGVLAATATPASADRLITRCDADGDRCVRMVCDNDGDDCRRTNNDYYRRNEWHHNYYDRYRYNNNYYNNNNYNYRRHWACDEDGDNCRWTYGY